MTHAHSSCAQPFLVSLTPLCAPKPHSPSHWQRDYDDVNVHTPQVLLDEIEAADRHDDGEDVEVDAFVEEVDDDDVDTNPNVDSDGEVDPDADSECKAPVGKDPDVDSECEAAAAAREDAADMAHSLVSRLSPLLWPPGEVATAYPTPASEGEEDEGEFLRRRRRNIQDILNSVQHAEVRGAKLSLREDKIKERAEAAQERRRRAEERARQQRDERERRRAKAPSEEELALDGQRAGVAAKARAAMVGVADVARLQELEVGRICIPTPCSPADPAHWSAADVDLPLLLTLLTDYMEVHRDELLIVWRSVCWGAAQYVMREQEQPDALGPKYLYSRPVELMSLAVLPRWCTAATRTRSFMACYQIDPGSCPCGGSVRNMLACDGLSEPTFTNHSNGMLLGGAIADAIAGRVQLHVHVSDVLHRLQSGAPIEGITTELHLRVRYAC